MSVPMVIALAGLGLCLWAIAKGFGASEYDRSAIFVGPLGCVVNLVALLIGLGLMALGLLVYLGPLG